MRAMALETLPSTFPGSNQEAQASFVTIIYITSSSQHLNLESMSETWRYTYLSRSATSDQLS